MNRLCVVTPYYNAPEALFNACARSILANPLTDLEWVVVDDGSDPQHRTLLDDFSQSDNRVRVLHRGHEGVSSARNAGLEAVDAEYFTFVDADDEVSPFFFLRALELLDKFDLDVVYGRLLRPGEPFPAKPRGTAPILLEGDMLKRFRRSIVAGERISGLPDVKSFAPYPVAPKAYRTSTFGTLRFDARMSLGEDSLFNALAVANTSGLLLVDEPWYRYVIHPASATQTAFPEILIKHLSSFEHFNRIGEELGWNPSDMGMRYVHSLINMSLVLANSSSFAALAAFIAKATALPAAVHLESIDSSQYELSGRFSVILDALVARRPYLSAALCKGRSAIHAMKGHARARTRIARGDFYRS